MDTLWTFTVIVMALVFVAFVYVIAFGAPFLPTLKQKIPIALELADLSHGQTLLELGSGDGRVLKEAAKAGLYAVGYELNPLLVVYSRLLTWKYRKQIRVVWGNYWKQTWPKTDAIFVFLLQPYMEKLDNEIKNKAQKNIKLVSFAFTIPGRKPTKTKEGLYLYNY